MNILFLTQLDFSSLEENNIYTDLLSEFRNQGHSVYIVSPVEKRKGIQTHLIEQDKFTILKLQIGNYQKIGLIEKGITLLTLEQSFKKAVRLYFSQVKFDLILYSTPPITLTGVVSYVKRRDQAKTYLLLKDIFPQNAVDLKMISKMNPLYWYFRMKERSLYRLSDHIGCMSEANVKYVRDQNPFLASEKIEVCPNSIRVKPFTETDKHVIKRKYGIPLDKTVFIYGGNFGQPQGIKFFIECLESLTENQDVVIVIVGSGAKRHLIETFLDVYKPSNVILLNELSREEYEILNASCDVGLIFLDHRFTIPNFPSRLLSYMNASLPTLAVTDKATDIGRIIVDNKLGLWCESNNVDDYIERVNQLKDPKLRYEYGQNAFQYLLDHYTSKHSYDIIMAHFR